MATLAEPSFRLFRFLLVLIFLFDGLATALRLGVGNTALAERPRIAAEFRFTRYAASFRPLIASRMTAAVFRAARRTGSVAKQASSILASLNRAVAIPKGHIDSRTGDL